ncbi:zinc finger CCHC domain-containing protein 8 [Caerostris extrusa]|uniref:Zinc finger CCHC domain-containing protein 8 n=1 Tax=Caerostris extrusa TaxID=172846 RepID=A0AAV4WXT2_CAEEX|nr:zinc finger CCHC domain-containing protein 8 [Caerostris extrusa]
MADVVGKIPKSKSIRRRIKKSKSRKRNFHLIKRDVENDEMHDSKTNNKRNSPQLDIKSKSYDHSERKQEINKHFSNISEDRSVSFRSRVNQRFGTSSHYPRSFHDDRLSGNNCDTNMHIPLPRDEDREIGDKRFVSFNQSTFSHDDEFVASLLEKIDYLRNQVDFLNQENERLKFGFTEMRNNDLSTEVNISFLNKELEERFVPILSELATDLIQGHISVCDLRAFLSTKKNSFNGAEDFRELPEESLFALDNSTSEIKEDPHVPVYETSFSEILETEEDKNESEAQKSASKKRFRRSCYNCSEDHVISQCPYKIDYYKVANCKKQAKKQQAASSTRYHLQESGGSDFKPGIISDTLREALGLRPNQIPLYIYRMRLISYPPGWLEEATVETSGINVYDSKGYGRFS